jgi:PAS domain-containing protein
VIFSIEAGVLYLRAPQLLLDIEMPIRSIGSDSGILIMIVGIALCSIIKSIPYFSMRFEELRQKIERDSSVVREQSRQLAQKNAELASAMHAVPVACIVTRPNLQILYMNAEARRLVNEYSEDTSRLTIGDRLFGMEGMSPLSIAALRHALLKTPASPEMALVEISVSGIERDDAASQWVFLLKPLVFSPQLIDSVWHSLLRRADRTALLCDSAGKVISAQPAWREVIGHCAIFGNNQPAQDASRMDLFASLRSFADDSSKLDRFEAEVLAGRGSSILLRGRVGGQLTVAISPLRGEGDTYYLLVDIFWRAPIVASMRAARLPSKAETTVVAENLKDIPSFLRK